MSTGLNIISAGMVTAVGLDRASSCAAMRGAIDGFGETNFIGAGGEPQIGAPVPLPRNWIGEKRLAHLAAGAIVDAMDGHWPKAGNLLLVLCLPEPERPGRPIRDVESFAALLRETAGLDQRTKTYVAEHGRPAGFVALDRAQAALSYGSVDHALIVGVDSLLTSATINRYREDGRLVGPDVPNAFLPGEAAAAILCAPGAPTNFALSGLGLSREKAHIYNPDGDPLRGDGMTTAYRRAMDAAGVTLAQIEYRVSDLIGEAYFFKQTALASLRLERGRSAFQDIWSPAESIGNVGAAVVPLMIAWALTAFEKGYDPGSPVLIEASADDGACGAAVFRSARRAA